MGKIGKIILAVGLTGFLGIGMLLFTNHWGLAIKITNYLYFLLLVGVGYEKIT
jgi:hypothetical protein